MLSRRDFLRVATIGVVSAPILVRSWRPTEAFVGKEVFDRIARKAAEQGWHGHDTGSLMSMVGSELVGTPYVGNTLELDDTHEFCSVNLLGLDCVTFYEVALGFARMIRHGKPTPEALLKEIQFMRYRGGQLDGYVSRLHYTSDWIFDNDRKHVVKSLTEGLPGAIRMDKRFDFMSTHPTAYRQLKADPSLLPRMAAIETEIGARRPYYVPNNHVAEIEPMLLTGDIVGIATNAEGLDCSHTGFVTVDELGMRRFFNASSVRKQVVIGERLSEYANKYKKNLGVMIARPL